MKTVPQAMEEFRKSLEVSDAYRKNIQSRVDSVRNVISNHIEIPDHNLRISGSYKRKTAIIPFNDVDIFLDLNRSELYHPGVDPDKIIRKMRDHLSMSFPGMEVREQKRSVGVIFESICTVDVVIAFKTFDEGWTIPDRETNEWISTNVIQHEELTKATNVRLNNLFIPLVKMIKYWNSTNKKQIGGEATKPLKSFHLEALGWLAFKDKTPVGYLDGLAHYFRFLHDNLSTPIFVNRTPMKFTIDEDRLQHTKERLAQAVKYINACERETNPHEQHMNLLRIFGQKYIFE